MKITIITNQYNNENLTNINIELNNIQSSIIIKNLKLKSENSELKKKHIELNEKLETLKKNT